MPPACGRSRSQRVCSYPAQARSGRRSRASRSVNAARAGLPSNSTAATSLVIGMSTPSRSARARAVRAVPTPARRPRRRRRGPRPSPRLAPRLLGRPSDTDPVAAVVLGGEQRAVGRRQHQRRLGAVVGERGDAQRDRQLAHRLGAAELERELGDLRANPLRDLLGRRLADIEQDDGELLAAVAGDQIVGAPAVLQDLGDPAQRIVARHVTVAVVVALEVIDVDHQDRQRQPSPVAALHLQRQPLAKVAVVVEAGETVGDRQLGEPRVQILELLGALDDLLFQRGVQRRQLGVLFPQLGQQLDAFALQPKARQQALNGEAQVGLVPWLGDVLIEPRLVDGVDDRVEQLDALHTGHDLIGDHHRDLLAVLLQIFDELERLAGVLGDGDVALVAEAGGELLAQGREDPLLVVDADNVLANDGTRRGQARSLLESDHDGQAPTAASFTGSGAGAGPSTGRRTSNRVRPGLLSTRIVPPCFSTMRAQMLRPRPVPSPFALVVKNGSKIRPATSAEIPGPVSSIATITSRFSALVSIRISPRPSMACIALWIRFVHTWFSSPTYADIAGNDPNDLFTLTPFSPYFN